MDEFIKKWKTDHKYKTKIKLLLYTFFVIIVSIYVISTNNSNDIQIENVQLTDNTQTSIETTASSIDIPQEYNYKITINIDDNKYQYSGTKNQNETTIIKEINDNITNYLYQNNNYYLVLNEDSIITTKEEVYDIINYNYLNLESINKYLETSTKEGNKNIIYLKDIILGNDSEEYFTIIINDNQIEIDYTNLMKYFNNNIQNCLVNIELEKIE